MMMKIFVPAVLCSLCLSGCALPVTTIDAKSPCLEVAYKSEKDVSQPYFSCETIVNKDGSTTTRIEASSAASLSSSVIKSLGDVAKTLADAALALAAKGAVVAQPR